jgi:phenylacetate-CoA ligase
MATSKKLERNDKRRFWPKQVAPADKLLFEIVSVLDATQWWPEDRLINLQQQHFAALLNHAKKNTDHYAEALKGLDTFTSADITEDLVRSLPIADKPTIQTDGDRFTAKEHDPRHGGITAFKTSGSVSMPVTIIWNQYANTFVSAKNFRYHQWHGSDPKKKMSTLRATEFAAKHASKGTRTRDWYPLMPGGESVTQSAFLPTAKQMEWLQRENPSYLLTIPTIASELVRYAQDNSISLSRLERIDVYGEKMDEDLASRAKDVFHCTVSDKYSSREMGEMATRCPVSGLYHIQSETVYLEVRKDDGTLASEREIGQIIVTNLHNTAMPIIRYAIEDYAEVGPKCSCGRGLPTLRRIMGRSRNMLRLENGEHVWLPLSSRNVFDVAPVRQVQLVQTAINEIKVLAVPLQTLSDNDKEALCEELWTHLPREVSLTVECVPDIPRSNGGKFEYFRSEIE